MTCCTSSQVCGRRRSLYCCEGPMTCGWRWGGGRRGAFVIVYELRTIVPFSFAQNNFPHWHGTNNVHHFLPASSYHNVHPEVPTSIFMEPLWQTHLLPRFACSRVNLFLKLLAPLSDNVNLSQVPSTTSACQPDMYQTFVGLCCSSAASSGDAMGCRGIGLHICFTAGHGQPTGNARQSQ